MRQVLRAGVLGRPRGMGWGGRWEGVSGWGTHVNPWLIHVNVWQKPLQYCKVISLQLIKINEKISKMTEDWKKNNKGPTPCPSRTTQRPSHLQSSPYNWSLGCIWVVVQLLLPSSDSFCQFPSQSLLHREPHLWSKKADSKMGLFKSGSPAVWLVMRTLPLVVGKALTAAVKILGDRHWKAEVSH